MRKGYVGTPRETTARLVEDCAQHELAFVIYAILEMNAEHREDRRGEIEIAVSDLARRVHRSRSLVYKELCHLERSGWIMKRRRGNQHVDTLYYLPSYPPRPALSPEGQSTIASTGALSSASSRALAPSNLSSRSNGQSGRGLRSSNQRTIETENHQIGSEQLGMEGHPSTSSTAGSEASLAEALRRSKHDFALGNSPYEDSRYLRAVLNEAGGLDVALRAAKVLERETRAGEVRNPRGRFRVLVRDLAAEERERRRRSEEVARPEGPLGDAIREVADAKRL